MALRSSITLEQKEILQRKFDGGMQGCNKSTLAMRKEASVQTGLQIWTIDVSTS